MRACGLTPGQLWRLVTQQTGLMGLTAGLLSMPVGVTMAAIMVHVINRRSFGWSLELDVLPLTLVRRGGRFGACWSRSACVHAARVTLNVSLVFCVPANVSLTPLRRTP